jgi:CHAT domain-containing protein
VIQPLAVTPPPRILVVFASASDCPPLDTQAEWKQLQSALQTPALRGLIVVDRLDHATVATLQTKLRKAEYHIFHFIGHGGFDEQTQDGMLMLEDTDGNCSRTSGRDLGVLLGDCRTLRLVLLNACDGARSGRKNLFVGVAQTLVRQGIPAVIAMQFPVTDQAAILLASAFYGAVADGYPIDAALAEARKQIYLGGDKLQWGTPVLYLRTPDGQIFDIAAASSSAAAPTTTTVDPAVVNLPAAEIAPTADAQAAATVPAVLTGAATVPPVDTPANPSEWHEVLLLDRHAGAVNRATFSPDRKWTVTTGASKSCQWD